MLEIILNTALYFALSYESFRRLQGANYRPARGYFKLLISPYFAALVLLQGAVLAVKLCRFPSWIQCVLYGVTALVFLLIPRKCPLKFTKRILRFAFVQAL